MEKITIIPENLSNLAIILPCLNEGQKLIKTVENLEIELGNEFDLIIVDGRSTDGSIQQLISTPLKILQSILIANKGNGFIFSIPVETFFV